MVVRDLTTEYINCVMHQQDRISYEQSYPALFEHYYRYWCPRERVTPPLAETEIKTRTGRVLAAIGLAENHLQKVPLNTRTLRIVLFVGAHTSNGHAFHDGHDFVVWLPVETYTSDILARVFVSHEIFHALHYRSTPEFYFFDEETKNHLGRQVITEGLATFLTSAILSVSDAQALWGDYLSQEDLEWWFDECRKDVTDLSTYCRLHFDACDPKCNLFRIADGCDVRKCRGGYYLGLIVIRKVATKFGLNARALLEMKRHKFEQLVIDELASRGRQGPS
jgi:hypothetical protein